MAVASSLRRKSRRPRRRGIVILIVISVLVLFMLMLVTFAVVSGHYRDAARGFAYHRAVSKDIADSNHVLDDVLNMLLAEPRSANNSLFSHSILGDLYGDSVNGV